MAEPTITDAEFKESCDNRERMYETELMRAPVEASNVQERTFMDRLGRGRWPIDYYTARARGYSHADAMQVERVRIREAAGLPATEPLPTPPDPPPQPEPEPPTEEPGVKDNMERFANFYLQECGRRGWAPNEHTDRDGRVKFLQETVLRYRDLHGDDSFVMKRADPTRPISDEAVVFIGSATHPIESSDYRRFWDFIISGGSSEWKIAVNGHGEILPISQPLVDPVTLETMYG